MATPMLRARRRGLTATTASEATEGEAASPDAGSLQPANDGTPSPYTLSKDVLVSNATQGQEVISSRKGDKLRFKVLGNETHAVQIELEPGQVVRAEAGSLAFMSDGITMETNMVGGLGGSLKRVLSGSSLMLTDFTYTGASGFGRVVFSPEHPSKIIPLRLSEHGGVIICAKDSYLCSEPSLELEVEFVKKMTFGFFGGEGFILQKVTGDGLVLLKGGGVVIQKDLKEGEEIRVSTGNLVAFERSVGYDLQVVPGFKNVIFGGEGLFLTTLKGPGRVFLESMPFTRIVSTILQHLPSR